MDYSISLFHVYQPNQNRSCLAWNLHKAAQNTRKDTLSGRSELLPLVDTPGKRWEESSFPSLGLIYLIWERVEMKQISG